MKLNDLLHRNMDLQPWVEGERVPWDDPEFSDRVLTEHLAQDNDAASRPVKQIKKHVDWIHKKLLKGLPSKILELGCGPGFYTEQLAALGHSCTGIDFAPAPIKYARDNAPEKCAYLLGDIRNVEYGENFDLVFLIFGAFNLFKPVDAINILEKIFASLKPGGKLLLELSSLDSVDQIGNQPAMWYTAEKALFYNKPHICLMETFWDEDTLTATERFYIVDTNSGEVIHLAASTQGYDEDELLSILAENGFSDLSIIPSLTGRDENEINDFLVITARKPA